MMFRLSGLVSRAGPNSLVARHPPCNVSRQHPRRHLSTSLKAPQVLFSDNHLLVVNKPAGWHSVPNPWPSEKCLLSELKRMKLGGGSQNDFLLSIHRIDQPCTGVMLFAKTSKAATKLTSMWKRKLVSKEYLCIVPTERIRLASENSKPDKRGWHQIDGFIDRSKKQKSVQVFSNERSLDPAISRKISLQWRLIRRSDMQNRSVEMVRVKTNDGARHMVRALFAQVGQCPIAGDIRYNPDPTSVALPDRSVALHASRVSIDPSLKLGSLETLNFEAPIPQIWTHSFRIPGLF